MLDENLPTFRLKPSSDNPHSSLFYFTHNGSEPAPEYVLRRPEPSRPEARNKYAIAVCDPYNADVVYGEVLVEPIWTHPTLSSAELRAQAQGGAPPVPATANIPDTFTVQLYNPDQSVTIKMIPGSFTRTDSWEFELPVQSFQTPTTSALDREQQASGPATTELIPRVMFRWKRDGRISREMTCYVAGKRIGALKNKDPDITVAMYKASRESVLTVYQPNMHRVEIEDRKGLELVFLLASEVIKDFWLSPRMNVFNVQAGGVGSNGAAAAASSSANKRKDSRPNVNTSAPAAAMAGALPMNPSPTQPQPTTTANATPKPRQPSSSEIDAETRRIRAMVEREEREREKAQRAEQKRIQKMIEQEEKERRRREAEVAKETERLRKLYGVEGQELPSERQKQQQQQPPQPPRPPPPPQQPPPMLNPAPPTLPPRPVSAGPYSQRPGSSSGGHGYGHGQGSGQGSGHGYGHGHGRASQGNSPNPGQGPFHVSALNTLWKGAAIGLQTLQTQIEKHNQGSSSGSGNGSRPSGRRKSEDEREKIRRKKSSQW
ncbi:hypothetical protein VTJ83DRAFT_840 [Remersonia thermophila]|uniref:Uncharacterized protein n=1 Tax=Remersonia thermophila TaxID=72144 RepID=A0ABR4DPQ8_9PEZI